MPSFRFSKADEAVVEVLEGATDSMESVITTMVESGQAAASSSSTNIPFSLPGQKHKFKHSATQVFDLIGFFNHGNGLLDTKTMGK